MKNNKLPLKERYNNFIQKHPKFWLTLIYAVLMLALAIAMLIATFSQPSNETASANSRALGACPIQNYNSHIAFSTSNETISLEDAFEIAFFLDQSGDFGLISCAASFELIGSGGPILVSYRYLAYYKFYVTLPAGENVSYASLYFTNSQQDPRDDGYPADRLSLINKSESSDPFYISDAHYALLNTTYLPNGFIDKVFPAMDLALISELIQENGCWAPTGGTCNPDDLKAEYDKGHADGYEDGYNKGKLDGTTVDLNPISIFLEPVSAFMNIKLFGFVSLGLVFNIVLFVSLALIFIKLFAGG